ncbi:hypothetical protein EON62_02120, partial [archaeon]
MAQLGSARSIEVHAATRREEWQRIVNRRCRRHHIISRIPQPALSAPLPIPTAAMGKVYGIHFEDEATSVLARRVMSVSCAMACLALVSGVLQLISYSYYSIGVFAAVVI